MKDEFDNVVADLFSNQIDKIVVPPIPEILKGTKEPRMLRPESRKVPRRGPPLRTGIAVTAVKIAGAAVVAVACVLVAPRGVSSPVAKGASLLFIDTELRTSISAAALEISFALGKSIVKE